MQMRLVAASFPTPSELTELLLDLDAGENGFGGTPVSTGELTLNEYIQQCLEMTDVAKLQPGYVPQTVFWALDEDEIAIGMARVRHYLNDRLREHGGHIGYYIRKDKRNKGYGKEVLHQALTKLREMGEKRALLTVDMENIASIKVITTNGGVLESDGSGPEGQRIGRFWIKLNG